MNEEKKEKLERIIDELLDKSYICYSVKELGYKIAYDMIGEDTEDAPYLAYKLVKESITVYIHKVAILIDNMYYIFNLMWTRNSLIIRDYYIVEELDDTFEYIEDALEDEEDE